MFFFSKKMGTKLIFSSADELRSDQFIRLFKIEFEIERDYKISMSTPWPHDRVEGEALPLGIP